MTPEVTRAIAERTPEAVELAVALVPGRPDIQAGLWLIVGDLDRAHTICQSDESSTGSWWHAIVHRREGDYGNSLYWYRQAAAHPAISGFDGPALVRDAERGVAGVSEREDAEWQLLMDWCLNA